jgi:hypothetical protein
MKESVKTGARQKSPGQLLAARICFLAMHISGRFATPAILLPLTFELQDLPESGFLAKHFQVGSHRRAEFVSFEANLSRTFRLWGVAAFFCKQYCESCIDFIMPCASNQKHT